MPVIKGHVRRSQLVTTYGVGSIVALGDESFMVTGIDRWPMAEIDLHEPRLERQLGVHGFVVPPSGGESDSEDVPVIRFPRWYSCPKCRRLDDHRRLTSSRDSNTCGTCSRVLVPSRFVVACPRGHIGEFPYMRWAHNGPAPDGPTHQLRLEAGGASASLRDIHIKCACGASRTMDKAFDQFALRDITRCFGARPWLTIDDPECDQQMRTLQRGASNVWFGSHRSVISIPPWSDSAFQLLDKYWDIIRGFTPIMLQAALEDLDLAAGTSFTTADLVEAVKERKRRQEGDTGPASEEGLRFDEYRALIAGKPDQPGSQFSAQPSPVPRSLSGFMSNVMLVSRLREVRALQGFSRIVPTSGGSDDLAPLSSADPGWRPAIEVKGEGLFVTVDRARLESWETRADVIDRISAIDRHYKQRSAEWGKEPDRTITPRLILIHTLTHAFLDQLALDAGYPAAALRERLYVGAEMEGLLVYTATTDSAGSLGGLIAQGEPEPFEHAMRSAIARHGWCSADPICIESPPHGTDSLNLAACHACALLPETSCEEMNTLLDRAVLVGTPENPELGFFSDLLSLD